jgi:hypothetical protein
MRNVSGALFPSHRQKQRLRFAGLAIAGCVFAAGCGVARDDKGFHKYCKQQYRVEILNPTAFAVFIDEWAKEKGSFSYRGINGPRGSFRWELAPRRMGPSGDKIEQAFGYDLYGNLWFLKYENQQVAIVEEVSIAIPTLGATMSSDCAETFPKEFYLSKGF